MSAQRRTATKREAAGRVPAVSAPPKAARAKEKEEVGRPSRVAARTEGLRRLYRDTMAEVKKVNWPDAETTRNLTIVVIAVAVTLGLLLGAIDFVLRLLFEALP